MKKILLLLLLATIVYGQKKDAVVIYGTVTSAYKDLKLENSTGIEINYNTPNNSYLTFEGVDRNGFYSRKLEEANTIILSTNYHDFCAKDVVINSPNKDSIRIDLVLVPKLYNFTSAQATKDILNKEIQIIIYDSLEYLWSQKIDTKKKFGFNYKLMAEPGDADFANNIKNYNITVEDYLTQQHSDWNVNLSVARDSMLNLNADNYGRRNKINIGKLKVPEIKLLPKKMQEEITMWQSNYNNWYKDKLKDYTAVYTFNVITSDKQYSNFRLMPERVSMEYQAMIPKLIALISNAKEIGMEGFNGIMLGRETFLEPTQSFECIGIPFSADDLYTVAGRANHLLKLLTGENFGTISPDPKEVRLNTLQNRWAYWLLQLQK